jgi:hypothetical protein
LSEKRSSLVAERLLNGESLDDPNPAESDVEKVGRRCRGIHCCPEQRRRERQKAEDSARSAIGVAHRRQTRESRWKKGRRGGDER